MTLLGWFRCRLNAQYNSAYRVVYRPLSTLLAHVTRSPQKREPSLASLEQQQQQQSLLKKGGGGGGDGGGQQEHTSTSTMPSVFNSMRPNSTVSGSEPL